MSDQPVQPPASQLPPVPPPPSPSGMPPPLRFSQGWSPIPVPTAPRTGGLLRALMTSIILTIVGGSLSLNGYLLYLKSQEQDRPAFDKKMLYSGDEKTTIAVVRLDDVIDDATAEEFAELVRQVTADETVRAVIIDMNTPGGTVSASESIYNQIELLRGENDWPVFVSMRDMGTSGGYYVACAADRIFAQQTTWTGNIGVILPRLSLAKLGQRYGVEDRSVTSSGATFKNVGSIWADDSPEATSYLQSLADEAAGSFKKVIIDGRGLDPATVDQIANGKVYTGAEAKRLKLIDDVGFLDDAVAAVRQQIKHPDAQVVRFERSSSHNSGRAASATSGVDPVEATVGGLKVKVSEKLLRGLSSGKPMYVFQN